MTRMDAGGGVSVVTTMPLDDKIASLVDHDVPSRLAAKDSGLWGEAARDEAEIRLGWLDTFEQSHALLPRLDSLKIRLREQGIDHVVLAGMGGSSLAPEVICRTLDVPLTVLDTTSPDTIRQALADRLESTVVVVSSKSGGTIETESLRRAYAQAFTDAGVKNVGDHFVIVTDSGSPLEQRGTAMKATVFCADPNVGGRYSALTAFGLVPAALAGVDVAALLDEAATFAGSLTNATPDNPAVALGAALTVEPTLSISDDGSGIIGLGDWAEQLIAESTGKDDTGVLPFVLESPVAPGVRTSGQVNAVVGGASTMTSDGSSVRLTPPDIAVHGPLGAQFLCWEAATAYAGYLLQINPFDQPNVAESKDNTNRILDSGAAIEKPSFVEEHIEARGTDANNLAQALAQLVEGLSGDDYLAVTAFLDPHSDEYVAQLRALLSRKLTVPVTFGWGPRYLHSTGQFHKGGRQTGRFLHITGVVEEDIEVPGRAYGFGELQAAQAQGDRESLSQKNRPLLHVHLTDRAAGIDQLINAVKELPVQ